MVVLFFYQKGAGPCEAAEAPIWDGWSPSACCSAGKKHWQKLGNCMFERGDCSHFRCVPFSWNVWCFASLSRNFILSESFRSLFSLYRLSLSSASSSRRRIVRSLDQIFILMGKMHYIHAPTKRIITIFSPAADIKKNHFVETYIVAVTCVEAQTLALLRSPTETWLCRKKSWR